MGHNLVKQQLTTLLRYGNICIKKIFFQHLPWSVSKQNEMGEAHTAHMGEVTNM